MLRRAEFSPRAAAIARFRVAGAMWSRFLRAPSARGLYDAVASSITSVIGSYQILDPRRKILPADWRYMRSYTANELATMSLPQLRTLCRKLERDQPTARAVVEGHVAQIVGTGIALEPDHGDDTLNARIRAVWHDYIASCDITGRRSIYDLEALACRELVVAGEFLWRTPVLSERLDAGLLPLCVLPLECEWLAPDVPPAATDTAAPAPLTIVSGIELDPWGRPVAYHVRNPGMAMYGDIERLPAAEVIHEFERRRALQNRGEPWLAPLIERLWQEGDLVDAELRSAVNCAAMAMVITSPTHDGLDTTNEGTTDDPAQKMPLGGIMRLFPGEDAKAFSHDRPSQQIGEFRRTLRGDIAAASRLSQRWLDRDYSRANYSSMRADNLDSDRLLAPVREWFGHATIGALYVRVLPWLCLKAGVPMPKRVAYRLLPDGQAYVDPMKDAQAAALAIAAGLSTHEAEVAKRGGDYLAIWKQKAKEVAQAKALGLNFSVALPGVQAAADDGGTQAPAAADDAGDTSSQPKKPAKKPKETANAA